MEKLYALYNTKEEVVAVGTIKEISSSYGLSVPLLRYYASKKNNGIKFRLYAIESDCDTERGRNESSIVK